MKYEEIICFRSVESLISFVRDIEHREENFHILSGNYKLNAKSILSVIALGTEYPIKILVNSNDETVKNIIDRYKTGRGIDN